MFIGLDQHGTINQLRKVVAAGGGLLVPFLNGFLYVREAGAWVTVDLILCIRYSSSGWMWVYVYGGCGWIGCDRMGWDPGVAWRGDERGYRGMPPPEKLNWPNGLRGGSKIQEAAVGES